VQNELYGKNTFFILYETFVFQRVHSENTNNTFIVGDRKVKVLPLPLFYESNHNKMILGGEGRLIFSALGYICKK